MEMMNRAIEDAAAFKDMMRKATHGDRAATSQAAVPPDVAEWNAEVDRKKAEKLERRRVRKLLEAVRP